MRLRTALLPSARFSGAKGLLQGWPAASRLESGGSLGFPQGGFVTPLSGTRCHCLRHSLGSWGCGVRGHHTNHCQEPQCSDCEHQTGSWSFSTHVHPQSRAESDGEMSHRVFSPLAGQGCLPCLTQSFVGHFTETDFRDQEILSHISKLLDCLL